MAQLRFSLDEYADRLARVRRAMAERDLDVVVATDPSNMGWLTGYDGWSFYTHQAVVVSHDRDPIYWGRMMDTNGARRTVYMDDEHIIGYGDHFVQSTERHPHQELARLVTEWDWASARIGVELDNYYYSAAAHEHLTTGLPGADIVDATGLINWQRAVKSPAELDLMRKAARVVERMYAVIRDLVEPGVRKNDVVAEIYRAAIAGTEEAGGDYPAIVPMLPTGVDASAPHLTWDDTPFESGAGTFFEIAGVVSRYHVPLCRTVYLGTPPPAFRAAEQAMLAGVEAGLAAATPGATAGDIARALASTLTEAGVDRQPGRCGYSIGLSYPPDWGERTISLRPEDETVLEPGMTFHYMPGIWTDEWGLEITESILIRESGSAAPLADCPREVVVKP